MRPALARLADSVLAVAVTRGKLVSLEFAEERERLVRRLLLLALGSMLLSLAALFGGLLIVVAFWDTHRLLAILGTGLAFLAAGGWLLWRSGPSDRDGTPPFAATLAEFEKDRAWLARYREPGERRQD